VSACDGSVRDPAALLALPGVAALPRPLFVLLPLVAHFWPPALAAAVLGEWGALPPVPGGVGERDADHAVARASAASAASAS
jgi:hypothetical protein